MTVASPPRSDPHLVDVNQEGRDLVRRGLAVHRNAIVRDELEDLEELQDLTQQLNRATAATEPD